MKLLYATTNPGKVWEVGKHVKQFGIVVVTPKDLGLAVIDVPEEGKTLEENAAAKVSAYLKHGIDIPIIADDTGIEIDALHGEPGIHVRRWKDGKTRMNDQDIIDYCLLQLSGIPTAKRGAQFRTVIALAHPDSKGLSFPAQGQSLRNSIELFDGVLRGEILERPIPLRVEGFPFESLFYIPEWKLVLGEAHQLPIEKKNKFLSHRERAVMNALPRIRALLVLK